jgi:hypothetical protein
MSSPEDEKLAGDKKQAASMFEQRHHAVSLSRMAEAVRGCCSSPAAGKDRGLPPKPLLVAAPQEAGDYPRMLFLHGYLTTNTYSQLLQHVASHGFVVVGPQVCIRFRLAHGTSRRGGAAWDQIRRRGNRCHGEAAPSDRPPSTAR